MSKETKKSVAKFALGAAVGAGLGVLFAPKKGSETREDLKEKFEALKEKVKSINVEDVKEEFEIKIEEIKNDLTDLDKEKVLKIAKKKAGQIKDKTEDLAKLAVEKGTPVVQKAVDELREKAIEVTKNVLDKLESSKE